MVSRETTQRKAVEAEGVAVGAAESRTTKVRVSWWVVGLTFLTGFVVAVLLGFAVSSMFVGRTDGDGLVVGECPSLNGVINSNECNSDAELMQKVDFQGVVDDWVRSVGGKKGVIVYDLMAGEVAGEYNADVKFATASVYKLFVVYAGYVKVNNGEWDINDAAGGTGRTIAACLDLAIRESDSECAETLWEMIGRNELDAIVREEFELPNVEVESLMATPREIMQIMLKFYTHYEITNDGLMAVMKDSFLNQPKTIYDWRQGLPSGFSDAAKVYNKVGWEYDGHQWTIYDDAAIVEFTDNGRDFIVVVMTSGVDFKEIRRFGVEFEQYYNSVR